MNVNMHNTDGRFVCKSEIYNGYCVDNVNGFTNLTGKHLVYLI